MTAKSDPMTLTLAEIEELERLEKEATPGPWSILGEPWARLALVDERQTELADAPHERRKDVSLVVALRNACPALLVAARENPKLRERVTLMTAISRAFHVDQEGKGIEDTDDLLKRCQGKPTLREENASLRAELERMRELLGELRGDCTAECGTARALDSRRECSCGAVKRQARIDAALSFGKEAMTAAQDWDRLFRALNGLPTIGVVGVRDSEYPCEEFDGEHYDGRGKCMSDGHYLCTECSHLSVDAPRFYNNRDGRRDRLRLYWSHPRFWTGSPRDARIDAALSAGRMKP